MKLQSGTQCCGFKYVLDINLYNDVDLLPLCSQTHETLNNKYGIFCCYRLFFQYVYKLCHLLLWKCCIQPIYLIFNVLYWFLYAAFTMVNFQWIKNISMCKCAVLQCFTFSLGLHLHLIYLGLHLHYDSVYIAHQLAWRCFQSLHLA